MNRDTWTQLIAVIVMIVSLAASGVLAVGLTSSGGRYRLGYTDTTVEGQPPQVALGIAMGAFRGLFVNALWIRANNLKEEGRFYESMDLARVITKLQPRFPQVWVFHAWNMAYNISVQTQTPAERWQWVKAGIELMRDQGLPANPNDLLMHKELGWIFLHKVGGFMDEANLFYKKQLALEWSFVLGPPPPPDPRNRDRQKMTDKYVEWLRPVAEAPDSLDEVIAKNPLVRTLVDRVKADTRFDPDWKLVHNYIALQIVAKSGQRKVFESSIDDRRRALLAVMEDPTLQAAWPPLIAFIKKRIIVEEYKMEPDRMLRYTQMYGPIDWRHFAAHGLYWAQRGVDNALPRVTAANKQDFDFINAGRVAVQSLQELWRSGDLMFDFSAFIRSENLDQIIYRGAPSIAFIDSYRQQLEWFRSLSWADNPRRVYSFYSAGYENLMKDAIRFMYRRGQYELANKYKDELGVWEHANANDPDRAELMALPLEDFVRKELGDEALKRPSVMREELVGALQGAFVGGLLAGDDELFTKQMTYAKWVHEYFFKTQGVLTLVSRPDGGRMAQVSRDFNLVAGTEFAALLSILEPDDAEKVYDGAPDWIKVYGYDFLRENFKAWMDEAAAKGEHRPFDKVFVEPPGMAEHRRKMEEMFKNPPQGGPAVEEK